MRTHDRLHAMPRIPLASTPTPLQPLDRLTRTLGGPRCWIKRDDLTGLATGGNKTRKLEFLMADAQARGADCVITAGGPQSNHCRQTAAAAARMNMQCHVLLGGQPDGPALGNLLLDQLLGAEVHWVQPSERRLAMDELASQLRAQGHAPYVIPIGGSNAIGALGYVLAMFELEEQLRRLDLHVDTIVFATSSGGTQAGLMLGARLVGFAGTLLAVSIDQLPDDESDFKFAEHIRHTASCAAELLGESIAPDEFRPEINYDFLGDGYGVVGCLEPDAIRLLARTEGILIGPVYTGRAFGGMLELIGRGAIRQDQSVLFWHTGDETTLHAYSNDLAE